MTLKTVYSSLKDYGYKYQSVYAYKAFPEEDEWYDLIYSNQLTMAGPRSGAFVEFDPFTNNKR